MLLGKPMEVDEGPDPLTNKKQITVTRPLLPELAELTPLLERIWESGRLTNGGRSRPCAFVAR